MIAASLPLVRHSPEAGAKASPCHGRKYRAGRKLYKKLMRVNRPGYVSRIVQRQIASYRNGARRVFPRELVLGRSGLDPADGRVQLLVRGMGVAGGRERARVAGKALGQVEVFGGPVDVRDGRM